MDSKLQIVLPVPVPSPIVVGVPAAVRTALSLSDEGRVFLCTGAPESIAEWKERFSGKQIEEFAAYNGAGPLRSRLDGAAPLLLLAPGGFPSAEKLTEFVREARASGGTGAWYTGGRPVAAYLPSASVWLEKLADAKSPAADAVEKAAKGARRFDAADGSWDQLENAADAARAEKRFFDSLRSDADGYIARLDRTLSLSVSKLLLQTPVTPNHLTSFSLAVGLLGSWLLASPDYAPSLLGAVLLWSCCVFDGCDGEIARMKLLSSEFGAKFDVVADNVVHVAIFAAIPFHLKARNPNADFTGPGLVLLAGVLLCMFWVWWLILRKPESEHGPAAKVFERIASRDFIYLILGLTIAQRLEWFLWSAAVGSHVFWLALLGLSRRKA